MASTHDLIASSDWDEVKRRLISLDANNQFCASNVNSDGFNPFHLACAKDDVPTEVITEMVMIDRTNLTKPESSRRRGTPLHLASETGSVATVQTLLTMSEAARERARTADGRGLFPLDVAWTKHIDGGNVSYDTSVNTSGACAENIKQMNSVSSTQDLIPDLRKLVDKTFLLLLAGSAPANKTGVELDSIHDHKWVHIAAASGGRDSSWCPRNVMWLLLKLYPLDIFLKDESGNLPLHVLAAQPTHMYLHIEHDNTDEEVKKIVGEMERLPIVQLIDRYPEAAKVWNKSGRLPLHLAIESGKKWNKGISALVDAAPDTLEAIDKETRLYPFMLAASTHAPPDVTYNLLRACPMLVTGGIRPLMSGM